MEVEEDDTVTAFREEWLYAITRDLDEKISVHAFDLTYQLWQPLPPIPGEFSEAYRFSSAVLSGFHLYVFGGKDLVKGSMRRVVFYSARTNKWRRAPDMLRGTHRKNLWYVKVGLIVDVGNRMVSFPCNLSRCCACYFCLRLRLSLMLPDVRFVCHTYCWQ